MAKRLSARKIASMKPEKFQKLTPEEQVSVLSRAEELLIKRLKTIERKGLKNMAYAYEKYMPEIPEDYNKLNKYQTSYVFARFQDAIKAKTSTWQGITKVIKTEEQRIGLDFATEDERYAFWHTYEEFMHQNPKYYDQSARVQQMLASMTTWRKANVYGEGSKWSFTSQDISELLNKVRGWII